MSKNCVQILVQSIGRVHGLWAGGHGLWAKGIVYGPDAWPMGRVHGLWAGYAIYGPGYGLWVGCSVCGPVTRSIGCVRGVNEPKYSLTS